MPVLAGIDIADGGRNLQPETLSTIGELDVITGHNQVIAISLVMEPQAGDDFAALQIVFDVHKRVPVTAERPHCLGLLEPWRADPPKDQGSATHRPDKAENFAGLFWESLPQFRPREELKHFRVIIGPEPGVAGDRKRGLGNGKVARAVSEIDRPVHLADQKLSRRKSVCRYQGHSEEKQRSRFLGLLPRAAPGSNGSLQVVIDVQGQIEIAENFTAPAMEYERARAVGFDDLADMGREDHRAVGPLFKKLFVRSLLEAVVPCGYHLVDQVAVKIDRQREGEHEAGPHSCGIGPHWFRQKFPQLSKVIHVSFYFDKRFVIDARDKAHVIVPRQTSVEAAGQSDWPGYAHGLFDGTVGRQFNPADEADQR